MRLIRALRDCKQRSLTVSKKAPTVSKKASPDLLTRMLCTFCPLTILGDFYRILEMSNPNRQRTKCTEHASQMIRPSKRLELYIFQKRGHRKRCNSSRNGYAIVHTRQRKRFPKEASCQALSLEKLQGFEAQLLRDTCPIVEHNWAQRTLAVLKILRRS